MVDWFLASESGPDELGCACRLRDKKGLADVGRPVRQGIDGAKPGLGEEKSLGNSEMALQAFEIAKNAPGNGAPVNRPPAGSENGFHGSLPQAMGRCSLATGADGTPSRELNFLLWIAGNPLKSPESDEGIQENPSLFSWSCLVWLGFGLEEFGLNHRRHHCKFGPPSRGDLAELNECPGAPASSSSFVPFVDSSCPSW